MSWTLDAPPDTVATMWSISSWVKVASVTICGAIDVALAGMRFGGMSIEAWLPMVSARPAGVGCAKSARTSLEMPSRRRRSISATASRE